MRNLLIFSTDVGSPSLFFNERRAQLNTDTFKRGFNCKHSDFDFNRYIEHKKWNNPSYYPQYSQLSSNTLKQTAADMNTLFVMVLFVMGTAYGDASNCTELQGTNPPCVAQNHWSSYIKCLNINLDTFLIFIY